MKNRNMPRDCGIFFHKTQHSASPCICHIELDRGKVHKNLLFILCQRAGGIDLCTSTQQNAVKNKNMLIGYGVFSLKRHTAYHHASVIVHFTGGKCINIHISWKGLSLFIFLFGITDWYITQKNTIQRQGSIQSLFPFRKWDIFILKSLLRTPFVILDAP